MASLMTRLPIVGRASRRSRVKRLADRVWRLARVGAGAAFLRRASQRRPDLAEQARHSHPPNDVLDRVDALERALRHQRIVFTALLAGLAAVLTLRPMIAQAPPDAIRTRQLIVEDEAGRPRIRLGAPLPGRGTPRTGLRITDTRGFERLGLNLFDDGRMVVGIDAPPPTNGNVGNLERINLVADRDGGGYLVFKNRQSSVVARLAIEPSDRAALEFTDYTRTPPVVRRLALEGDDTVR